MIRSKHITTTFVAASSLAAIVPAHASAHHILGHGAVSAVQQDVQVAAAEAQRQVSSAQTAIENIGANTRRYVSETVEAQTADASRRVSRVRGSVLAQADQARRTVEARVAPVAAGARRRVEQNKEEAEQRAQRAQSSGRRTVGHVRTNVEGRVARTREIVEDQSAASRRQVEALTYRITRSIDELSERGAITVSAGGDEYSVGWERSGACWTVRLNTPFSPPASQFKRRTGATVEPTKGQRASADSSQGNAAVSAGC